VTPSYNDSDGKAVSGATLFGDLDVYTRSTVNSLPTGEVVWAGPRDDSFFSDIPGIFDLLDVRILDNNGSLSDGLGQDGNGVDGFKGFNVLSISMQIPIDDLDARGIPGMYDTVFFGRQKGVGVYATVSRPRVTVRKSDGSVVNAGGWLQVSRLGNPLFTEGLVAFRDKDRFNRSTPDWDASFATYARNPELATLINAVFGTSFAAANRTDLDDGPGTAVRTNRLPATGLHRRRHDEWRLGRLAERSSPRGRRSRHRAHGDSERTCVLEHHGRGRQRGRERPAIPPGLPLPRDATRRCEQSQGSDAVIDHYT
jgi:hypothetical protein